MSNKKYYIMAVVGLIAIAAVSIAIVKQNNSGEMNEQNIDFSEMYPDKNSNEDLFLSDNDFSGNSLNNITDEKLFSQGNVKGASDSKISEKAVKEDEQSSSTEDVANGQLEVTGTDSVELADNDKPVEQAGEENAVADIGESGETEQEAVAEAVSGKNVETAEISDNDIKAAVEALSFDKAAGLRWPVTGNIIMNYSPDHVIYHATLNQFRTNPAIIISCEEGTEVLAAASGIVTDISNSNVTGVTITTDIGNGYKVFYGQLEETEFKLGDKVEEGSIIGKIAKASHFYCKEGTNLYFKVQNEEGTVNPMTLLRADNEKLAGAE